MAAWQAMGLYTFTGTKSGISAVAADHVYECQCTIVSSLLSECQWIFFSLSLLHIRTIERMSLGIILTD